MSAAGVGLPSGEAKAFSEPVSSAGPAQAFEPGLKYRGSSSGQEDQPAPEQAAEEQAAREQRNELMLATRFLRHHSGPLPDPATLAAYEQILPGAAERIFSRFEDQSKHRMAMEAKVIQSNTFSQNWSTVLATATALIATAGSIFLAHEGQYVAGLSVFFGTLFSFLGTYVLGRKFQADERREKTNEPHP